LIQLKRASAEQPARGEWRAFERDAAGSGRVRQRSSRGDMPRRKRDPRDVEIAQRVRTLRLQRGMSQTELGNVLDVTFQQVQKYETGANRISAGRLQQIAEVLDVPVTYFYADAQDGERPAGIKPAAEFNLLQSAHAVRLVRAYERIPDRRTRLKLLKLAECIADV
jgi:transcriptional regulator with XRE-family HTH domain